MYDAAFIALDWGTSSFRLWLIGHDGRVLAERRSAELRPEPPSPFGSAADLKL